MCHGRPRWLPHKSVFLYKAGGRTLSLDVCLYPSRERRRSNADTVDVGVFEARRLLVEELLNLSKGMGSKFSRRGI